MTRHRSPAVHLGSGILDGEKSLKLRRCRRDLIRHRQDQLTMKHWLRHRWLSAAVGALALVCAPTAWAQEAPSASPAAAPMVLPGVADIDFSLRGRPTERPGTPTEGEARPAPAASPAPPVSAPTVSPTQPVRRDTPQRPQFTHAIAIACSARRRGFRYAAERR